MLYQAIPRARAGRLAAELDLQPDEERLLGQSHEAERGHHPGRRIIEWPVHRAAPQGDRRARVPSVRKGRRRKEWQGVASPPASERWAMELLTSRRCLALEFAFGIWKVGSLCCWAFSRGRQA